MFEFTIHQGEMLSGSSRRPTNIEVNETGIGIGAFKRTMHPWSEISDVAIDGPETSQSRVTATRLVTLGVFALAAKKTTSETLVIVTLKTGEVITMMFNKKTEPEVKAIFAPHLRKISANQDKPVTTNPKTLQNKPVPTSKTRIEQLRELRDLLERGLIDENEFRDLKSEMFQSNNEEAQPFLSEEQDSENQSSAALPPRPLICDGDIDEQGVEYVVRHSSGGVILAVIPNPSEWKSLVEIDLRRQSAEYWRHEHRLRSENFTKILKNQFKNEWKSGRKCHRGVSISDAEKVITEFEELGCVVSVCNWKKELSGRAHSYSEEFSECKNLSKGAYKLVEIPDNEDFSEAQNVNALTTCGIYEWDGKNESEIIEILRANSVAEAGDPTFTDLKPGLIPHYYPLCDMRYGATLELFPKLSALGCKMRRIEILSPEQENSPKDQNGYPLYPRRMDIL